jgi:uncharacterized protein YyaL (SSP411 family)
LLRVIDRLYFYLLAIPHPTSAISCSMNASWSERLDTGFHPHLISLKTSSEVKNSLFDKRFPPTKDVTAYVCGKGYSTGPIQNENEVFENINAH